MVTENRRVRFVFTGETDDAPAVVHVVAYGPRDAFQFRPDGGKRKRGAVARNEEATIPSGPRVLPGPEAGPDLGAGLNVAMETGVVRPDGFKATPAGERAGKGEECVFHGVGVNGFKGARLAAMGASLPESFHKEKEKLHGKS